MLRNRRLSLDDPSLTIARKEVLKRKKFFKKIYQDWYELLIENQSDPTGFTIELGSGAGFLKRLLPRSLSTDILFLPFIDIVLDGIRLPFQVNCIENILMINVFHHISNIPSFMNEAIRVVKKGGRIIMIEPWVNKWANWINSHLHHEDFDPSTDKWGFLSSGPLSGANQALPWIVFDRDRHIFEEKYPEFKIKKIQPIMPFLYFLSGGFSFQISMPVFTYDFWKWFEEKFFNRNRWGVFSLIVLEKVK